MEAEKKCYTWYQQQPRRMSFPWLGSCPCSVFQAIRDRRFQIDWRLRDPVSSRRTCFRRRFFRRRVTIYIINDETNFIERAYGEWSQRCCYSNSFNQAFGSLLVGPKNGGHARLEIYDRYNRPIRHFLNDEEAHKACCVDSNLCHLFYRKRPSDTCWFYQPPRISMWDRRHVIHESSI
jgi:fibulin 1/2